MRYSGEPFAIVQKRNWYKVSIDKSHWDDRAREVIRACRNHPSDGEFCYAEANGGDAGWVTRTFMFSKEEDAVFFQLKYGA